MSEFKLVSPIPISVNHYMKARGFIKNKKAVVTMYETAESKEYKKYFIKYIKQEAISQKITWIPNKTQHFHVDAVFYFDRIDKDCNNYWKLILDSITDSGCVWDDDNVALERVMRIYYDSKNPRIELTIYPVDYIGIFDNQEQLDEFKSNCIQCAKYKDGRCSVFQKSLEGRIQEEIQNMECSKFKLVKIKLQEERYCGKSISKNFKGSM